MNEEAHWDGIATNYNKEIFDVFKCDRNKKLPRYFKKHGDRTQSAIDFGCGTGKAFPYLSPLFKKILAIDISSECLTLAKQGPYSNITFKRLDLSRRNLRLPPADFAFCCNVIMLPEIKKNEAMIQNIQKSLRTNGTALLVMPSLDSMFFSAWRLIDWYRKEGVTPEKIPSSELSYFKGSKRDILQGMFILMAFLRSIIHIRKLKCCSRAQTWRSPPLKSWNMIGIRNLQHRQHGWDSLIHGTGLLSAKK